MGLESAPNNLISELVASNPAGSDDRSQGDDHIRLVKAVLQGTFPNANKQFRFPTVLGAKTADYSVQATDDNSVIPVDTSSGAVTLTLPSSPIDGYSLWVTKIDSSANAVTVDGFGSDTINGVATVSLRFQWQMIRLVWSNTASKWFAAEPEGWKAPLGTKTSNYSATLADLGKVVPVDTSSGSVTVTLPASPPAGYTLKVVKTDSVANAVVVAGSGAETINGVSSLSLVLPWQQLEVVWNGSSWYGGITELVAGVPAAKTGNYSVVLADHRKLIPVDATAGALTIALPASPPTGFQCTVMKVDSSSNNVVLDPAGADTINGGSTLVLEKQYHAQDVRWSGSEWLAPLPDRTAHVPVGTVLMWPLETTPEKYLECDGSAVSRTTYAELFALLGVYYGAGDGSTTFHLPDYRGCLIVGWDHGRGRDTGASAREKTTASGATMLAGDHVGTQRGTDAAAGSFTGFGQYGNVYMQFVIRALP